MSGVRRRLSRKVVSAEASAPGRLLPSGLRLRCRWTVRAMLTGLLCLLCLLGLGSASTVCLRAADEPATGPSSPRAVEAANQTGREVTQPDSLWRLADPQAALWLEIRDLKDWKSVRDAAWFQQLLRSPVIERWLGSGDFQAVRQAWSSAEKSLHSPLVPIIETLFGQQVLLQVRLDDKQQAKGVLLSNATNEETLRRMIADWNRIEQARLKELTHAGQVYFRRQTGMGTLYYALLGRTLCLSVDASEIEAVLKQVPAGSAREGENRAEKPGSDVAATAGARSKPAGSRIDPDWERNFSPLTGRTPIRLLVQPRAWDQALHLDPVSVSRNEDARLGSELWQQVDRICAGVSFQDGIATECVITLSNEKTSAAWKAFARRSLGTPQMLPAFPEDAFVRMAGRVDLGLLSDLLPITLTADQLRELTAVRRMAKGLCLGLDLLDDIFRMFEVNWGLCIVPTREERTDGWPVDLVLAWELPRSEAPARMGVGWKRALENALLTGMNVWAASMNSERAEGLAVLRTEERAGTSIQVLDGMDGYRPAWAMGGGYLWLATSPILIQEMLQSRSVELNPEQKRSRTRLMSRYGCQQWLQMNSRAGREWLLERREALMTSLARSQKTTPEKIGSRLDRLVELLRMTDDIFAGIEIQPEQLRLVIGTSVGN